MKNLFLNLGILLGFVSILFSSTAFGESFKAAKTLDAVVVWDNGKAYLFKGSKYIRYDMKADRADPGYPKPINNETWPGVPDFLY